MIGSFQGNLVFLSGDNGCHILARSLNFRSSFEGHGLRNWCLRIRAGALDLYDPQSESAEIHIVNHATPIEESTSHPWDQGYDLAEEVHERIENDFCENGFVDVEGIIKAHGVHIGNLTLSDTHVRCVAIAGPQHKPGMFINECYAPNADEAGRRFTLAHEFCHLLFDQDQGQALAVASGPWAPRAIEQRANAFAAMLLMPTFLLKQMLSGLTVPITKKGDVDDLAKHLLVGRLPLLHHLANLGFMEYEDPRRLEFERSWRCCRRSHP